MANPTDMLTYECEFDEEPTRIGRVFLSTDETALVAVYRGNVEVPIFPPDDDDDADDLRPVFRLSMTPRESRDLAGLLIYAAGRAEEATGDRCVDCDRPIALTDDD